MTKFIEILVDIKFLFWTQLIRLNFKIVMYLLPGVDKTVTKIHMSKSKYGKKKTIMIYVNFNIRFKIS